MSKKINNNTLVVSVEKLNINETDKVVIKNGKIFIEYNKLSKMVQQTNYGKPKRCSSIVKEPKQKRCSSIVEEGDTAFKENGVKTNTKECKGNVSERGNIERKCLMKNCYILVRKIEEKVDFMAKFGLAPSFKYKPKYSASNGDNILKRRIKRGILKQCKVVVTRLSLTGKIHKE